MLKNKNIVPCMGRIFSFTSEKQNTITSPSIIKKLKVKKIKLRLKMLITKEIF